LVKKYKQHTGKFSYHNSLFLVHFSFARQKNSIFSTVLDIFILKKADTPQPKGVRAHSIK